MSARRGRRSAPRPGALLGPVLVLLALAATVAAADAPLAAAPPPDVAPETRPLCPITESRVYVEEAGGGHPTSVVLVHGVGNEAARIWDRLIGELADRYHVVAFDLPGFGRSDKPDLLYSPALLARVLGWVVDRYAGGRATVVGHSLGGAVALWYAATTPDAVDRLILADVAGVLYRSALTQHFLDRKIDAVGGDLPTGPLNALKRWAGDVVSRLDRLPVDVDSWLETARAREEHFGGDPQAVASLALAQADFGPLLGRVRAPTLILWGSEDAVAPLRTGKLLAYRLPTARLEIVTGAGHVLMRDAPEEFLRQVRGALETPPVPREPGPPPDRERVARCLGKDGVIFTGAYREIVVSQCREVRIEDVAAERIVLTNATAVMENTRVTGGEAGLVLSDARLVATAVDVDATADALVATRSVVDAAGVSLRGGRAAVRADDRSTLLFSVSRVRDPERDDFVHGYWVKPKPAPAETQPP